MQGNPRTNVLTFSQQQDVLLKVGSQELDLDRLTWALGSGNTSTGSGSEEILEFGGDPAVVQIALHLQHEMAQSGHTLNAYIWAAQSDSGVVFPFTQDEHTREFAFRAIHASTNWAGEALGQEARLLKMVREII